MEVHLLADTNLFFECRALEELPWGELGHDPVIILLAKPVLDEIDKHKRANGRTRKRALDIYKRVRGMLANSTTDLVVQEASPRVVLRRIPNVAPDETLSGALDYTKNDDRLIGILATLSKDALDCEIKLFTDDTGPAATADGFRLPFAMINEEWRRPAEETTADKKIRELEKDLATYHSCEPRISISLFVPADDADVVTVVRKIAQPLTEPEITEMLDILRRKHPMRMDFSPATAPRSSVSQVKSGTIIQLEPPNDEDIGNYQNVLYPQWLNNCRAILSELHIGRDEIENPVILQWTLSNDGTRPALHVRVQFEAQGPLLIKRLRDRTDEEGAGNGQSSLAENAVPKLPPPPNPPAFREVATQIPVPPNATSGRSFINSTLLAKADSRNALNRIDAAYKALAPINHNPLLSALKGFDQLGGTSRLFEQNRGMSGTPGIDAIRRVATIMQRAEIESLELSRPFIPPKHDREAFYYDWPETTSVKKGALKCDLWRHQGDEELFVFEVLFTQGGDARGAILCTVHAENLTKPATSRISIVRKVELLSLLELARTLVEQCG